MFVLLSCFLCCVRILMSPFRAELPNKDVNSPIYSLLTCEVVGPERARPSVWFLILARIPVSWKSVGGRPGLRLHKRMLHVKEEIWFGYLHDQLIQPESGMKTRLKTPGFCCPLIHSDPISDLIPSKKLSKRLNINLFLLYQVDSGLKLNTT